jgi:hypothetical protein
MWGVCENPAIVLDVAHWQGADPFVGTKDKGVRAALIKRYHGRASLAVYQTQVESAKRAGLELLGDYAWLVPNLMPVDLQVDAWAKPVDGSMGFWIDWEDPDTKLRGRPLVSILERAIEIKSDKDGRRPVIYTGSWYWGNKPGDGSFCEGMDSEIVASCPLHLAAYPRKSNVGTRYTDAVAEVCAGIMPAIPLPWAKRCLQPLLWQFDGDKGLVLPSGVDVDVNVADWARLTAMLDAAPDTLPEGEAARQRSQERAATALRAGSGQHTLKDLE